MENKQKFVPVSEENLEQVNGGNDGQEKNNPATIEGWKNNIPGAESNIPGWEGHWFYFDTPGEQDN